MCSTYSEIYKKIILQFKCIDKRNNKRQHLKLYKDKIT